MIISIEANSVNTDLTAPTGAVWTGSTLFDQEASNTFQQMALLRLALYGLMISLLSLH